MDQAKTHEARLLADKSSFQAWSCVSFGYALLALVLLSSRLHEISTDLRLLLAIDQLLWAQPGAGGAASMAPEAAGALNSTGWPQVALDTLLVAPGEPGAGSDANGSLLAAHMQVSLSRELSGSQLLRQEVEAFVGELSVGGGQGLTGDT